MEPAKADLQHIHKYLVGSYFYSVFFVQLGARIAERRKAQVITQIQMAETLGVSQQTVNSYEVAQRRVPVSALPMLAKLLTVSTDELLGEQPKKTNGKRGPACKSSA